MFEIIFEQKIIDFKDLKMLFMPVALIFILNGSVSSFILEKIRMKCFLVHQHIALSFINLAFNSKQMLGFLMI